MKSKGNFRFEKCMEKMTEDIVSDAGIKIKEQSQKSMAGRDHYTHRILVRGSKQTGIPQCILETKQTITLESPLRYLLQCISLSTA
jgi:tRNA(Leu) C34 or U34 (ribose-2'-O)-methylase TrmL